MGARATRREGKGRAIRREGKEKVIRREEMEEEEEEDRRCVRTSQRGSESSMHTCPAPCI